MLLEKIKSSGFTAFASAFKDPRFSPVTTSELNNITVEISVLTPMEPIDVCNEAELIAQLQPHKDGLLISNQRHRATFLPQVWKQLRDPDEFLKHLKQKAGLATDQWPEDMQCHQYGCIKFTEDGMEK